MIAGMAMMLAFSASGSFAGTLSGLAPVTVAADNTKLVSQRPPVNERLFVSDAIEKKIKEVKKLLKGNAYLAWMFENCFPNTIDTTAHFDGKDDTFVYTGDIHAMWLRDSGAQVWPYVQYANKDEKLRKMIRGVILRQLKCINIDPYANAFNMGPVENNEWASDQTDMKPELHERKYEIDSLCYPIRLAYHYWQVTGDTSVFGDEWKQAVANILKTFREQQRKTDKGPYRFLRVTDRQLDTVCNAGYGNPVNPVGLIASVFRPSDDATTFLFLVPSNFMAVSSLRKAATILSEVNADAATATECRKLADEVSEALRKYAVVHHPKYGDIYAFEVDGFQRSESARPAIPRRCGCERPHLSEHTPLRLEQGQPLLLQRQGRRRHRRPACGLRHGMANVGDDARLHQSGRRRDKAVHRDAHAHRRRNRIHARDIQRARLKQIHTPMVCMGKHSLRRTHRETRG